MAKIDELLQELCPDGVEYVPLGKVCDFINGFSFKSSLFKEQGIPIIRITNLNGISVDIDDVKFFDPKDYSCNLQSFAINQGDILVAMSGATTGKIGRYTHQNISYLNQRVGKFVPYSSKLANMYLFHYLLFKSNKLYLMSGGGAQPNLSSTKLMQEFYIPLPPLPIQQHIVEVLDTFTDAISNLEEELALREKQFEYYREQLLSFDDETSLAIKLFSDRVENVKVGEACEVITDYVAAGSFAALRNKVTYLKDDGYAQLVRTSDLKQNFSNSKDFVYVSKDAFEFLWRVNLNTECIILPNVGINCGEVYYISPNLLNHQYNVLGPNAIKVESNKHNNRFLFFLFQTKKVQNEIKKITSSGGQPKFNKTKLKDIIISLPSLNEQHEIVEILDTFDAMIANIKEEIALRTKQYEYYREKLLSFGK